MIKDLGSDVQVDVEFINRVSKAEFTVADKLPCNGDGIRVRVRYDSFPLTMPLIGELVGADENYSIPISASVIRGDIYAAMVEPSAEVGVFGHGYTYSGHPVACAAALKTLEIYERDGIYQHAASMGEYLQSRLAQLRDHERVGEVRGAGLIAAVELVEDKDSRAPDAAMAKRATQLAQDNGLIVRNVAGCALAVCPPLIINREQVDELVDKLQLSIEQAT